MKIDHIQNNVVGLPPADTSQRTDGKVPGDTPSGTRSTVSLSKLATHINQLAKQVDAGNTVNLDRVNAIRQAIENGNYRISSEGIASAMLNPIQPATTKA